MAKISDNEIEHVMALARLKLEDSEKSQMTCDLEAILNYVAECEKAPTDGISATEQISLLENISRSDEINSSLPVEKVLQNAPEKNNNFIKTKQVFE